MNPEILTLFKEQLKLPENKIKLVLVPEPVIEDLKALNVSVTDLLDYNKVKNTLQPNALKELLLLNSLSNLAYKKADVNELLSQVVHNSINSSQFKLMLGETIDLRLLYQTQLPELTNESELLLPSDEEGGYPYEQYTYDVYKVLSKCIHGIESQIVNINKTMYENTHVSICGCYIFIPVPCSSVERDMSEKSLEVFTKEVFETSLRKATIYHSEQLISSTGIFGSYLIGF